MFTSKYKKSSSTLCVLLALVMFLSPLVSGYGLAYALTKINTDINNMTCKSCIDQEIYTFSKDNLGISINLLNEEEAQDYINIITNSKTFKNEGFLPGDNIIAVHAMPLDIIQITTNINNASNESVDAFIDAKTGDIISIVHLVWKGFDKNDVITLTKYLENGYKEVSVYNWKQIYKEGNEFRAQLKDFISQGKDKELSKKSTDMQIQGIGDWYSWVCAFTGATACGVGCMVFAANPDRYQTCVSMCSIIWGAGLC